MEVSVLTHRWKPKRKIGFKFDMYAWFYLCDMHGIEINELNKLDQEVLVQDLFYSAAVSYCKDKGKKVRFDKETLLGWIDKLSKTELDKLSADLANSRVFGKTMSEWGEQGVKKK